MENERTKFEALLRRVNESETLKEVLKILSYAAMFVSAYAFFYGAVLLSLREPLVGIGYIATIVLPALLLLLLTRLIKAPRPCDLFDFYETKGKRGYSFPDLALFFAFASGTLILFVHFTLGLITLSLSLVLCATRTLLGRSFVRDVVAGGLLGIATSLIGYFLLIL